MPVNAFGGDRDFGHQRRAGEHHTRHRDALVGDRSHDLIATRDPKVIEEVVEGAQVARRRCVDGGGHPHPEAQPEGRADSCHCFGPGPPAAMRVVHLRRRRSRLICSATLSRGIDSSSRKPLPLNTIPLVNTVVGSNAAQLRTIAPMSGSRNGSPPVRNISCTPQSAASLASRAIRSALSSRRGVCGDDATQQ